MGILTYISRFIQPEQITELRAFDSDGIVYSGWFEHKYLSRLASIATDLDRTNRYKGIYFVPNPIEFELLDRRKNKIGQGGSCTADKDILFRKWLLIDIDPVRPANVSATESERQHAWQVCSHVQSALAAGGITSPIIGSSGNGWHLSYPISLPNNDQVRLQLQTMLTELDMRCSTEHAKVDRKTFNASRIWKLYGTSARKGLHTEDRPHRIAFVQSSESPSESVIQTNSNSILTLLNNWKRQADSIAVMDRMTSDNAIISRARNYLKQLPSAVSGQNGHDKTFHAAMVLVEGFGLSVDDARVLLHEYSSRCEPPWSDREIEHKLSDAMKNARNIGHLLREHSQSITVQTPVSTIPIQDDPDATAADLIAAAATITWTWPQWIQRGTLTCLASDPGVGKTRLCADLTRRLWHGLPWPDGTEATMPKGSRVMWIASDSQWAELGTLPGEFAFSPEAIVLNGRRSNPYAGTNLDSDEDLAEFELRIRRVQPALIFVDTTGNATDRSTGRPEEAKQFFKPLAEIATRTNTSIILVTHLNRSGQVLGNRILGAVRQVIMLDHPDRVQENRRRLAMAKTNSIKPPTLGITMSAAGNTYDQNPPGDDNIVKPAGRPSHLDGDMEWLREYLATGAKRVSQCRSDASASNIGPGRLYRAKDGLQVNEYSVDNRLWWSLPTEDSDEDQDDDNGQDTE